MRIEPIEGTRGREYFEIKHWGGRVDGYIPRDACEAMGVDCSPADQVPQGTIFFSKEQSERIRAHPEFMTAWPDEGQDDHASE